MNKSIIISENVKANFSAHATLAATCMKMKNLRLFDPIACKVRIAQKTLRYRPTDKLMGAFIATLAGAHGMVEINRVLRADAGLQRAFRRTGFAEQPVV